MIISILTTIALIIGLVLLTPFFGYLWGRSQATGWIEAFKNSNIKIKPSNNGKEKEAEKTKI